jgi:hypothetical protein
VQGHREGLHCAGAQRNAFWPVDRDRSIFFHLNALRSQLSIDQFIEGNPATFRAKEQPRSAQNFKAVLKAGFEVVKCLAYSLVAAQRKTIRLAPARSRSSASGLRRRAGRQSKYEPQRESFTALTRNDTAQEPV